MPLDVIMPALGMAQESGQIVAWHKAPGEPVAEGDLLFEVETDKATMEVEAQAAGYLTGVCATAGEDVPVGQVIARITETPDEAALTGPQAEAEPAKTPLEVVERSVPKPTPAAVPVTDRILASPKARRLALEQGLDLARLVKAGHPQPFHVKDLEALRTLSAEPSLSSAAASRHLTAQIASNGFADFASWAAQDVGLTDTRALLAGLVAASFGRATVVAVESFGQTHTYTSDGHLGTVVATDDAPAVLLRDLRFSAVTAVRMGAEHIPVLTITRHDQGLSITLECAADQLAAVDAIALLANYAGRMEQPLRHLL